MKDWFKLAKEYKVLPLIFIQLMVVGLGEIILPFVTLQFTKGINALGTQKIYTILVSIILLNTLHVIIRYTKIYLNVTIREKFAHLYRSDMFEKVCSLSLKNLQDYSIPRLTQACGTAYQVCEIGQDILCDIVGMLFCLATSVVILFRTDKFITIVMIAISIIIGIVYLAMQRKWKSIYLQKKEWNVKLISYISRLEGFLTIKSFTKEKFEIHKFRDDISTEFTNIAIKTKKGIGRRFTFISAMFGLFEIFLIVYLMITFDGDIARAISVGLLFYNLEGEIFSPLTNLPDMLDKYSDMKVQVESNNDIMNLGSEYEGPVELKSFEEDIVFNNVSFSYDNKDTDALKDVCLRIPKGTKVGIYGPSGSGKSTFVNLLLRFFKVTDGEILIDGENINEFTNKSLRKIIGNMSQEIFIFSDMTIKENIGYGIGSYTDAEIIDAAKKANAHDFISKLENGYDSKVGNNGVKLSGGERQRIALARLFLLNPPILIFDEATSKLDNASERLIKESIENLSKDKTVISIAHRLSTIKDSNILVGIKDGEIKEFGPPEFIMENGSLWQYLSMQVDTE